MRFNPITSRLTLQTELRMSRVDRLALFPRSRFTPKSFVKFSICSYERAGWLGTFPHMSPVDRAGPVTGTNFSMCSSEKFQPGFRDEKIKAKDPGDEFWCRIRETKQTWRNTKKFNFRAYHSFGNS